MKTKKTPEKPEPSASVKPAAPARPPTLGETILRLLETKNWNQSDLARAANMGRDSVSNYIRGRHFPEPGSLKKLADALRVTPNELCPEGALPVAYEANQFSFHQIASEPLKVCVRMDKVLSFDAFMKIAQIVKEEDSKV